MRVLAWADRPLAVLEYRTAVARNRTESKVLALESAFVDRLPHSVDALLVTSDLQGVHQDSSTGEIRLLGIGLADAFSAWAQEGIVPEPQATAVISAGDLYSSPGADVRGASGDVREVWWSLARRFKWVVGVHGNHDDFGGGPLFGPVTGTDNAYVLDGDVVERGGLTFGGVSYIIGRPTKAGRRGADAFVERLDRVCAMKPDVLVLHQGPASARPEENDPVRDCIQSHQMPLTIFGHQRWAQPLHEWPRGGQALNVDSRAVLLTLQPVGARDGAKSAEQPEEPGGDL